MAPDNTLFVKLLAGALTLLIAGPILWYGWTHLEFGAFAIVLMAAAATGATLYHKRRLNRERAPKE